MVWIGFISICCSKVAKEGKSCPRLLVLQRVARNAKSCSKVAEHNLFMPSIASLFSAEASGDLKGWGEGKKNAQATMGRGRTSAEQREIILRVCQSLLDSFL